MEYRKHLIQWLAHSICAVVTNQPFTQCSNRITRRQFYFFLISLFKLRPLYSNIMGLLTILCFPSTLSWLPSLLRFVFHIQWTIFNDPLSPLQLPSIFRRAVIGTAHSLPRTDTPRWQVYRSLNTESLMETMINLGLLPWDDGLSPCRQSSIVGRTWALGSAELYLNARLLLTVGPWASY